MCDNSSITRTKVGGALCKPCKCPVNRVKVGLIVLGRNRPYYTVLGTVQQSYENRLQIVFKP